MDTERIESPIRRSRKNPVVNISVKDLVIKHIDELACTCVCPVHGNKSESYVGPNT